jgi:hypothetical protein
VRWSIRQPCCSGVFVSTNRMFGRTTALQIASAQWHGTRRHCAPRNSRRLISPRAFRRTHRTTKTGPRKGRILIPDKVTVCDISPMSRWGHRTKPLALACRCGKKLRPCGSPLKRTTKSVPLPVQLPVACLRKAAAGPPKIEPTPCLRRIQKTVAQ